MLVVLVLVPLPVLVPVLVPVTVTAPPAEGGVVGARGVLELRLAAARRRLARARAFTSSSITIIEE